MEEQNENNTKAVDEKSGVLSIAKSFATKLATVGIIWGWGYMNWSIAWLIGPVILSVWKMEKKRDNELRRITAQAMAMSQEKQIIMNRLDELPSWVYFPDFDRAEWLNRILYKTWPSMNEFVRGLVKQSIQPAIVERLADYKMKGFQFERLVLGRIPAKICGIKVYDKNTSRNEIILDADILYAGDCDITFSFGNLKGGIKDFQIRGMIRVVMKPMIPVMPLIGGLQIFFLNNPTIDFNLVGAVDILDLPGFSDVLRKTIVEQIGAILVLPNKLAIPLSPEIPAEMLKTPEPEGVLRIHVVQAKHLMKKDIGMLGKGKSDPYAVINIGAEEFRTKTIDNTVDPKWDYWCECVISSAIAQQLTIHLWDYDDTKEDESLGSHDRLERESLSIEKDVDTFYTYACIKFVVQDGVGHCSRVTARLFDKDNTGQDDPLGRATIEVNRVKLKGTIDTWIALEFAKHGMVHLRLTWLQLTKNVSDLSAALNEIHQLRVTSLSSALLILYIDSAKNLPCLKGNKQPDVYLEASVSNRSKRTTTMLRSCDPVWEQGFTFLVSNPENDTLQIKIHDEKTGTIIGVMSFNLSLLLDKENLEIIQQPYTLQHASEEAKLVLSMALRILKYEEPEPTFEEDEDDHDINELNKKIERQESNNTPSSSIPPSPLKKQSSKESVHSVASSAISSSAGGLIVAAPVAEESIEETITSDSAALPIQAAPGLIHRNLSVTSSAGEAKLGRIQLTLRYSVPRQKLIVVVHKVANLPLPQNDPSNIPDPYVKLYLLPDKHKETKRKTAVMKDNCSPVFDEQFDYVISQADLETRTLEISVCTQKGWLSTGSNVMGQVHMTFADMDLTQPLTSWYDLMPENKD